MRLELEVEYDTEPEDEERHRRYVENGMDSDFAWRRVAQDALGNIGLIVQGAEAFER